MVLMRVIAIGEDITEDLSTHLKFVETKWELFFFLEEEIKKN